MTHSKPVEPVNPVASPGPLLADPPVTDRRVDWDLVSGREQSLAGPLCVAPSALEIRLRLEKKLPAPSRFIAFSSLRGNESVRLTALEVSKAFASGGRDPVLLVDTDVSEAGRSNDLDCGTDDGPGLFDWMRGETSLDDAVQTLVPGSLFLLPAGRVEPDPAGWLASATGAEVLAELRMQFSTVICASAPLSTAAGKILAARAEYLALVLERGRHGRSEVRAATEDARRVSECGVGVVLTDGISSEPSEMTLVRRVSKVASRIARRVW